MSSEINRSLDELLPQVAYELIVSEQEREALFRLRYIAYLKEEAVPPNDTGQLHDRFDDLPNSFNIGMKVGSHLVGAMRICVWSRQFRYETTPGLEVFREELASYLQPDAVMIDPNRFVVDVAFTQKQNAFAFALMRISFMACIKFQATIAIAAARREHCGFYIRSFGHKKVTEPRLYSGLIKPLALLVNDFPVNHQPTINKYPSFGLREDDLEKIFDSISRQCFSTERIR